MLLAACATPSAAPERSEPVRPSDAAIVRAPERTAPPASSAPGPRRPREAEGLAGCAPGPLFGVLPIALDQFRAFRPLGFPQLPSHIFGAKHSSFTINLPGEPRREGVAVRFPSDAVVTQLTRTTGQQPGYQLVFFPCAEFKSYFFHLGEVSPAIAQAFAASTPRCFEQDFGVGGKIAKCEAAMRLAVKAGDPVGISDGLAGVDWGAVDFRVDLPFVNLKRYDGEYPHMVSPVDYLVPELRAAMAPKLASLDGRRVRTAKPETGTIMQDRPGTAQGNWFTPGTSFIDQQDFSVWLGLLHDNVDPSVAVFAMGRSVPGLTMGLYAFTPRSDRRIDRDFSDVRPGGVYCYERFLTGMLPGGANLSEMRGVLLLEMPDERTLRVEHRADATCAAAPALSGRAAVFER